MGSNTFPQQQSMGQMPQQMAPMQQQDQQSGFSGMYAPQYGANVPMAGGIAMSGGMQGYGGGQFVPNYAPQGGFSMAMTPSGQNVYKGLDPAISYYNDAGKLSYEQASQMQNQMVNDKTGYMQNISDLPPAQDMAPEAYNPQGRPASAGYNEQLHASLQSYGGSQSVPNYQVPQIQQQPMAGYGGYAQQPMQQNPYGGNRGSSRQGPQRLY